MHEYIPFLINSDIKHNDKFIFCNRIEETALIRVWYLFAPARLYFILILFKRMFQNVFDLRGHTQ